VQNYKILVVEPSNVYQLVIQQFLEEHNCSPLFVKTGKEARELIEYSTFDLICVTMELPDMTGVTLCQEIRAAKGYSETVPIVMITATDDSCSLESALRAGANEIFHKNSLAKFSKFLAQQAFSKVFDSQISGNILYVEDSLSQAAMAIATLEEQGHSINHFTSAEDALNAFKQQSYDLVITDIFLDGALSGMDIVQTIRSNEDNKNIPILALSAAGDDKQKLDLLRHGANDYVIKPLIQEELLMRAHNLLTSKMLLDELEKQRKHFKEMAMQDQLTGLFNRHFLMEVGPKSITEAHRHQYALSMLVVDLDKFKLINDTHGHSTGDLVLESIGEVLLKSCRDEDIACRFGGEEFVLLLAHCDTAHAEIKAESLRELIEQTKPAGLNVTASIGVSSLFLEDSNDDIANLFSRADAGTYQAKDNGRNQVVVINSNQ